MRGLVIKNTGSWYLVKTDEGQLVNSKVRGKFRLKGIRSTSPVAVGDYVDITVGEEGSGLITSIEDRRNYIIRRASNLSKQSHILAANVDQCLLVVTVAHPETSTTFIDRFLASAEAYRVPVIIAVNKADIYDDDETAYAEAIVNLYTTIGYDCHIISAEEGTGLDPLREQLRGKVTLAAGHSGVGKSTLINTLLPQLDIKVGDISAYDTGMHTTTYSEMYPLPKGGYLIDIPGIKGFGTFDIEEDEVGHYFKEIFKISDKCKYNNCTHTHEPGCAVLQAVDNHYISESRYKSYLSMLQDKDEDKYRHGYS